MKKGVTEKVSQKRQRPTKQQRYHGPHQAMADAFDLLDSQRHNERGHVNMARSALEVRTLLFPYLIDKTVIMEGFRGEYVFPLEDVRREQVVARLGIGNEFDDIIRKITNRENNIREVWDLMHQVPGTAPDHLCAQIADSVRENFVIEGGMPSATQLINRFVLDDTYHTEFVHTANAVKEILRQHLVDEDLQDWDMGEQYEFPAEELPEEELNRDDTGMHIEYIKKRENYIRLSIKVMGDTIDEVPPHVLDRIG